ncbi:MAG: glycogen synthase GlgA [Candidatus Aminicenantes bacterium]|nr:glycogen synthase GlgA [Candidatus Aminicenantes bacterium]
MNILFLTSEAVPFAKTGGLADVSGVLPRFLAESANVSLIMPDYATRQIRELAPTVVATFSVRAGIHAFPAVIRKLSVSATLTIYFVVNDAFFAREFLYGDSAGDYPDNFIRFLFFQLAVLQFISDQGLHFDIVHCNDWQTAMVPLFLKSEPWSVALGRAKTVFSIHNLGYQGIFPAEVFAETGLPQRLFSPEYLEFYGKLNCLKAGIIFSDRLVTVSPTYAMEIVHADQGFGLEGLLGRFACKLSGILNGVDYSLWNPEVDPFIPFPFSFHSLEGKAKNKTALYGELGVAKESHVPLLVMISRISAQKGIDLLLKLLPELFQQEIHFVFLGIGDREWSEQLQVLAGRYREKMTFLNRFDERMAHWLEAAADILLMPSAYEPCGLNQIYSMKYGTVPVVRATGGLEDSVQEFDPATRRGTGFKFRGADVAAAAAAVRRALRFFADRDLWRQLQKNGMEMDFSWAKAVRQYIDLYKKALREEPCHG